MSAGPKSRHIAIRYFWIKDRIKAEDITIRHCPTLQMVADFFTKPLQGSLFKNFRDVIMGHKHMDTLALLAPMPLEERVGNTRQSRTDVSHISSTSNGTIAGLVDSAPSKRVTNTSWADVVRRGNCSDERTLRLVAPRSTNQSKAFREIILSKQSSE